MKIHCSHTEMRDIGKVKPNPRNPNTHPEDQIERLAAIIKEHGWRHPITISKRSGLVVAGHGRLLAAQRLNLTRVPVDVQAFKTQAEEAAVLMADNFIAELAETDALQVRELLVELQEEDYDLELVGLSEPILAGYLDTVGQDGNPWDGMPEFNQEDKQAFRSILVHFKTQADLDKFAKMVKPMITEKTKFIWFPDIEITKYMDKGYEA